MRNLVEVLRQRAQQFPERVAYTFLVDGEAEEVTLTYNELDQRARSIAALLESRQTHGQRVLLLYPPGLEYIAAFWGCLYAGAVAVPAYPPRLNRNFERLQAMVADSEATFALTTSATLALIEPVLAHTQGLKAIGWLTTDNLLHDPAADWRHPNITGESLAFLQYTSGSTAIPKGVMVTHRNLLHNEALIQRAFRQTEDSIIVGWLPLYHDMGLIGNVLQPVFAGGRCILMSPVAFLQRPLRWLQAISRYRATTSGAPNFAYDLCARKIAAAERETLNLSSWTTAFNGSEPVRAETLERFAETFTSCGFRASAFYPCYGLAEATLFVTGSYTPTVKRFAAKPLEQNHVVETEVNDPEGYRLVACGNPSDEQQVVIVDPETCIASARGTVGEIWIASESVADGYWKQPEETKLTFGARLASHQGGPFLRTGDLGFLHEGALFVTGRLKDLIIIRGRNLYPQDVEKTVQESHVALRPGGGAAFSVDVKIEERLVVVHEAERRAASVDHEEVLTAIRQAIAAEHEVQPYAIVIVKAGSVPKTSSGKVQRRAARKMFLAKGFEVLAEWREPEMPASGLQTAKVAQSPKSAEEIQNWLRAQLAGRLGVDAARIDLDQPITHYGVDSLAAVELMHGIETALGVALPFTSFYSNPSISHIAREISAAEGDRREESESPAYSCSVTVHPLTPGQQAMWFLYRLEPENGAYNVPVIVRFRHELDVTALRSAFQLLVDRHEVLRTTFGLRNGAVFQQVHQQMPVSFKQEDATGWDEVTLNQRLSEQAWQPFKLEEGPLFHIYLMKRLADDYLMQVVAHHIVSDLWSLTILLDELDKLYAAIKSGETIDTAAAVLPPLERRYTDYVHEQMLTLADDRGERLWSFWKENLRGELPALNLPTDRPRSAGNSNCGKVHAFRVNADLTDKLNALSRRSGTTLYMTLVAAYAVLLSRYTGQSEVIIGSPSAGRNRAAYTRVVGYFVNLLPLRVELKGNPRFSELLKHIRSAVLDAFAHQDYPFPLIVQRLQPNRDPSLTPLLQTMCVMQQTPLLAGHQLAPFALGSRGARIKLNGLTLESFPLAERATQFELSLAIAADGDQLSAVFEYNADLFDFATIESMAQHFIELLTSITANPEQQITSLSLLTESEEKTLLSDWSDTRRDYPVSDSLLSLFTAQAKKTPEAIALSWNTERISYSELDERSNRLAHYLRQRGASVEAVVGVLCHRTPELIVTLLAILKSGAAYLPLDPAYPAPRLHLMLEDSNARLLITTEDLVSLVEDVATPVMLLDKENNEIASCPAEALKDVGLCAENLAYLIYTSGSTGRPKPVAITHRSALTFLHWSREVFRAEELSGVLASTSVCFDLSVFELFAPLSWGGEVILVENALHLAQSEARSRVRLINTVPSAIAELLRMNAVPKDILAINLAGEALSRSLVHDIYEQTRVNRVLNLYGPSEDTTYSTWTEVPRDSVPTIGRPIANTQAYILDQEFQPSPVGVAGELYLGGEGLARGYLSRPDLTAEMFVPHPFSPVGGMRLYRTGDLARWLASGEIEFLGRLDNQVKLRGFRIELGEIEAVLRTHAAVRASVVVISHDRLVAYVVTEAADVTRNELRTYLKERLPEYMTPSVFMILPELPLTTTGKIDRRRLPEPDTSRPALEAGYVAPSNATEELVAGVWAEVLGLERVGVNDNFFELGGHSLLATTIAARIYELFQIELPLRMLFDAPTVGTLAIAIENATKQETGSGPPPRIMPLPRESLRRSRVLLSS